MTANKLSQVQAFFNSLELSDKLALKLAKKFRVKPAAIRSAHAEWVAVKFPSFD